MYDIYELNEKSLVELKEIALQLGVDNVNLPKNELVYCIIDQQAVHPDIIKDKKEKDDNTATEAVVVEKPKKRGRKIATSRPDKEFMENKEKEDAAEQSAQKAESQDTNESGDTKPKREKRPRIGKRTDVVKTTINNDDEENKVQHVSYAKKKSKASASETSETENKIKERQSSKAS